jgi:hypothetical protein
MTEMNRRWIYPTVTASENKGIERISLTGEGTAHEVVGVDGSRRYGCRPSSGFTLAHTIDIYKDFQGDDVAAEDATRPFSDKAPPVQSKTSTVTDCYPVNFQIREGEFGHGFVYRVKVSGSTNSAIYLDYVPTNTVDGDTGWRTVLISDHKSPTADVVNHVSSGDKMDVVSMGKYVFTFVKGRQPRVFYIDLDTSTGSNVYTHKVISGGPGPAPILKNVSSLDFPLFGTTASDANTGRGTGLWEDNPRGLLDAISGTAPATGSAADEVHFHNFASGDYSFAYYLHDSHTGRRSPLSTIGRRSADEVSISSKYVSIYVEIDESKFDQIYMFRSVKMQSVGSTYTGSILHLDNIYNVSDAAAYGSTYKGIRELAIDDTLATGYANTDVKIYECYFQLDDIALSMQDIYLDRMSCDEKMPFAGAAVPFEGSLVVSDPQGEEATITTDLNQRARDIGEIRWSSLTERSPELFPINNKYSPDVFQNRVTSLTRAGDFAIGFSGDRLYHMRRNGIYLKIEDLHAGFGLASTNGFATAGPVVYFVTTKGLKSVANNGQIDSVMSLDNLLLDEWYSDISSIRLAFDPYVSCLFIHNPVKEQTVCMWFGSGRVTELHDTCFDDVRSGIWPQTFTRNAYDDVTPVPTTSTTMVERSFFLQNHPSTTADNISTGWRPRVYVLDIDRTKKQVNSTDISVGQPRIRTLDAGGDSVFTVAGITDAATNKVISLKSGTTGTKELGGGGSLAKDLVGAYAYILSAADSAIVGKKFQIYSGVNGNVTVGGSGSITVNEGQPNAVPATLAVGDVIAISPVLTRYVGGSLPMTRTEQTKVITYFDLFQNKQISSIGCHFTDVSGGVTNYKFFRGLVYNTTSNSPAVNAFPLDFSGTIKGDSIKNGESEDYAAFTTTGLTTTGRHGIQDSALNPGLEIFCPDLDFKLMALICRGRTTGTDTGERNTS